MRTNLDRESAELERAYPGILARLETDPIDRVARDYRLPRSALFHARDRLRRLQTVTVEPPAPRAPRAPDIIPPPPPPQGPIQVKDASLQLGLEQAYPGITQALSRRDDVEVAVQFGISLPAIARIREALGVERAEVSSGTAPVIASRGLPARLVASRE